MRLPVLARRSVQRFTRSLTRAYARRDHARQPDPDAAAVAVVHRLQQAAATVEPSDEFRIGLRANLMARIEREGIGSTATATGPDPTPIRARRRHRRLRVATVGIAACVAIAAGFSVATHSAVPGDGLVYDVKRSAEQARISASTTPADRGRLYLEFARARMSEADTLTGDSTTLPAVLDVMDTQTRQGVALLTGAAVTGHTTTPLDTIAAFVADQRRAMTSVLADITGAARTRAYTSGQLLDDVSDRVDGLRTAIGCGAPAPTRSDSLGPKPRTCTPSDTQPYPTIAASPSTTPSPATAPAPTQPAAAPAKPVTAPSPEPSPIPTDNPPLPSAPPVVDQQDTQPPAGAPPVVDQPATVDDVQTVVDIIDGLLGHQ